MTNTAPTRRPPRRELLRASAAALAAALLGGCGFQLRRPAEMAFARIALVGFAPRSPLAAELRRSFPDNVQVVDAIAQAQVVLHALADQRERRVVARTAAGQVRELSLRLTLRFRLATPGDRELIAPTELTLSRELTYSEDIALAKALEDATLFAALQSDVIQQLLRRLARVARPED